MPPFPIFPSSPASSISGARNDKEKEKGVNVQVLLRCRPFNEEELRVNAPQVISCNEQRREVSVNLNIASKQIDRTFTFDKVFGPQAQQKDLYDQAVVPIVNEVLEGFNCTIFAYGQTGTGKTYTMEGGGKKSKSGDLSVDAGVIPRAVQQIFDTLESQNAEYSMKVTFLELYNEELTDLMAPDDLSRSVEDKQRKPLALMEDGKGGVLVRGLEEEIVYSANEIYNLLERGSAKRRTAETLLNKQSSRSHSIFSIIIHIKEATPEGEELIKCGKLNLVDLAGSENISRSGAREGRAREAGEINKSLLTLGRVITALVEHLGHVPYRDSKLTRLLRDSLGGRTKTCIIATVSPSVHCLEETLSTLDYAHRAKNIKNKPEVNQKMMKSTLIKDLYSEIEKLKTEVHAAREKNGIYLPRERYFQDEAERKAMSEKIEHMEFELEAKDKQLDEMQESLDSQQQLCAEVNAKLESTQKILEQTQDALAEAKESIKQSQYTIKEREYIITNMEESENTLVKRASNLQSDLESSVNDIAGLHLKIDRKDKVETENHRLVQGFHTQLAQNLETLHSTVTESVAQQQQQLQNVEQQLKSFLASKNESTEGLKNQVLHLKDAYCSGLRSLQELICSHEKDSSSTFGKLNTTVSAHASAVEVFLAEAVSKADMVLTDLQIALHDQESAIASFTQQQREGAQQRIEATRAISNVLVDFFEILEGSTTELCTSTQDNQQTQHQSLAELERTYEECSKQEEQQLLEKITEMLAAATARKTELVRSKVSRMQDDVGKNSNNMQQGIITIHNVTSGVQNQWNTYTQQTEDSHRKGSAALAAKHCNFEELLQRCVKSATMAGEQWKTSQESLQQLEKSNLLAADSVVKEGIYGNGLLLTNFERLSASIQSDVQTGNGSVLESITSSLHLDQEAGASLLSTAASKSLALTELQTCHHNGTVEIKDQADHCLNEEYLEDKPTCTTPKKRSIDVPSKASIEALRTPCVEKLLQDFRATHGSTIPEKSSSQKSFTSRESKIPIPADSSLLKDGRVPLTAVN